MRVETRLRLDEIELFGENKFERISVILGKIIAENLSILESIETGIYGISYRSDNITISLSNLCR